MNARVVARQNFDGLVRGRTYEVVESFRNGSPRRMRDGSISWIGSHTLRDVASGELVHDVAHLGMLTWPEGV